MCTRFDNVRLARYVTSNLGQTLVIKSITNDDEGHYTCTATNTLVGKTVKLEASKGTYITRLIGSQTLLDR